MPNAHDVLENSVYEKSVEKHVGVDTLYTTVDGHPPTQPHTLRETADDAAAGVGVDTTQKKKNSATTQTQTQTHFAHIFIYSLFESRPGLPQPCCAARAIGVAQRAIPKTK